MRRSRTLQSLAVIALGILNRCALGDEIDFARQVQPLLQKYCVGCHCEEDAKGNLRLDDAAAMFKGGKRGPAVIAGKSSDSLLIKLVLGETKPRMPPKDHPRPSEEEWTVVRSWIDAGAKPSTSTGSLDRTTSTPRSSAIRRPMPIRSVAVSPGGNLLAAARERAVEIIDISTMKVVRRLSEHAGPVNSVRFLADGKRLAAAGGEAGKSGEIRIWDVDSGKAIVTFHGHSDSLYAVASSPDQKTIAAAGYDKAISLWSLQSGKELRKLHGHNDAVFALAFRKDGKILASASGDRTVKLWDVQSGKRLDTLPQPTRELYAVAFEPNGKRLFAGGADNRIRVWEVSASAAEGTNRLLESRFAHQSAILEIAFSRDGKRLASSSEDRTVKLWSVDPLTELQLLEAQPDWAAALAFSDDGAALVVGRHDGTIALYDAANGKRKSSHQAVVSRPKVDAAAERFFQGMERLPTDSTDAAKTIALPKLPIGVEGAIARNGDVHRFQLSGKKGQRLVVDIEAVAIGSKLQPVVELYDGKGRLIPESDAIQNQRDPALLFRLAADGEYQLALRDAQFTGSADHRYRMAIGDFAVATGVHPISVPANATAEIELTGINIPPNAKLAITSAAAGTQVPVKLDPALYRQRGELNVHCESEGFVQEREPNDEPSQATVISAPGTAGGRITRRLDEKADVDLFRFHSKNGRRWIIETEASRRGSPLDTRIDVLDSGGNPIERVVLQATRDSAIHFRGINSTSSDVRVSNWEEMELNEFMYLRGEVCKLFRLPQGPDSGFLLYNRGGRRLTYFDTSSVAHAVNDPCYIVEPHPPGSKLIPNGLPTFVLHYTNDDSADRKIGSDSRLSFIAPAEGEYLVRVADARSKGGQNYHYRLIVREPRPDFTVSMAGVQVEVSPGSGRSLTMIADRIDGFDDDIAVEIAGLPQGFSASNPTVIQAGHLEAQAVLWATPDAPAPKPEDWAKTRIIARAAAQGTAAGKNVRVVATPAVDRNIPARARGKQAKVTGDLSAIRLGAAAKVTVRLEPAEIAIEPGSTAVATLIVERHGFDDRINFTVNNLPHGVYVDNIGLNGILIPKGENQRQIQLTARAWTPETRRPVFAVANVDNNQASKPVLLVVRRPKGLADANSADR